MDIHLACTCICVYVHADLRYAKLIVFIFSGMVWKRTSLTNSASMTPRAGCEFKKKNYLRLILYISAMKRCDDWKTLR